MIQLPEAIILDLDDTIIDDSGGVDACWEQACHEAALRIEGLDPGALHEAIEERRDWYWGTRSAIEKAGWTCARPAL